MRNAENGRPVYRDEQDRWRDTATDEIVGQVVDEADGWDAGVEPERWPARVVIRKDFDGKYAATWPSAVVSAGLSAGAGRHETQTALVAAIEAKGYTVERATGRSLLVTPAEVREPASWTIDGFTIHGERVTEVVR